MSRSWARQDSQAASRPIAPTEEEPIIAISAGPASVAQRLLPILGWLPAYRREWLLPHVLAGLAVWAVMVPEGMAYSGIVGVPPIMGLYTIIPPLIVYAVLGTSRVLVVGPDTATGLISISRSFSIQSASLGQFLVAAPSGG